MCGVLLIIHIIIASDNVPTCQEEEEQRQLAMYQLQEEVDELNKTKEETSQQLTQQCVLIENMQGQLEQAHKTIEVCILSLCVIIIYNIWKRA